MRLGFSVFGVGLALLAAFLPVSGCVCEHQRPKPEPVRIESAFFDFVQREEPSMLELWPASNQAPQRKKHQLVAQAQGADLVATNDGPDPFLVWDFENSAKAAALSIELFSAQPATLQFFWATEECKIYQERCSAKAQLKEGEQTIDFVVDPTRPLRGVRLDLPEEHGASVAFHRIRLLNRPRLSSTYEPRAEHTKVETTPDGLRISCKNPDPWVVFPTPGLEAARVSDVVIELNAPESAEPELFWMNDACKNFSESCKIGFERVPGKRDTFSAHLTGAANWSGQIGAVRFDPSNETGAYLLRRLAFLRGS